MIRVKMSLLWGAAFVLLIATFPSTAVQSCPEQCHCQHSLKTLHCTSLSFIHKLSSKELAAVVSLDVSNASLNSIDKKLLKKLVNLERLNLSDNKLRDLKHFPQLHKLSELNVRSNLIKHFLGRQLPSKLETLDISHNYIKELPRDLTSLHNLKYVDINGNFFNCHQNALETRDMLLERNIEIIGRATCNGPKKFQGKFWNSVVDFDEYFKLQNTDDIQADDARLLEEGSGQVDNNVFDNLHATSATEVENAADNDFIFVDPEPTENDHESEGSGFEPLPSTTEDSFDHGEDDYGGSGEPDVVELDDKYTQITENFTSTEPNIIEPLMIDKVIVHSMATPEPAPESAEETEDTGITTIEVPIEAVGESREQSSLGINIFLAIIVIILVALLVYAIKKNKERKRRRAKQKAEDLEKQEGQEMIQKPSIPSEKQNGNPETAPLMNGQSDEPEKDVETSMTSNLTCSPVEFRKKDAMNGSSRGSGESPYLSVPSRPNSHQDVVSVKVKASEIPDSIPRTPILVDRRKTSDGQNIMITPNLNQRASTGD